MRDIGARGYKRCHVKVTYITQWFMLTTEVDPEQDFGMPWKRVDKDVNELGIVW